MADFIAEARHPKTRKNWKLVAESKGSLGTRVDSSRIRAKTQVAATKLRFPQAARKLPLAFCSSVYFLNQGKQASCTVVDPPAELNGKELEVEPLTAWRITFSKAFRFVGLDISS